MGLMDLPIIDPLIRGDDEEIGFKIFEPGEDPEDPLATPQNLSGCTIRFSAKRDLSDASPLITKSSTNPAQISIDNASEGEGTIYIAAADLVGQTYETVLICDVEVTDAGGKRYTRRFKAPVELDVSQ
jgi:hypothetical protein